jgi:hypothetical protein
MGITLATTLPESFRKEPSPQCLDTNRQSFLGQLLASQCRSEVGITPLVGPQDFGFEAGIVLVVGGFAPQPVNDGGIAVCLELLLDASNLSDGELEQSRGFGLRAFAFKDGLHHLENIALTLTHLHTVPVLYLDHLAFPLGLNEEDTSIELTPDISNGVQHREFRTRGIVSSL